MPRSSLKEAANTRQRIIAAAVDRASEVGLEGVSVRDLARDLRMSKSGVLGPFDSRADLLASAFDSAIETFQAMVIAPITVTPGQDLLRDLIDRWIDYLANCPFPGGCFLTSASIELDHRPGPLRDRVVRAIADWHKFLTKEVRSLAPEAPVKRAKEVATTLVGIAMAANQEIQLLGDKTAASRAHNAMFAALDAFEEEAALSAD